MTYNVSSGTLNSTIPFSLSLTLGDGAFYTIYDHSSLGSTAATSAEFVLSECSCLYFCYISVCVIHMLILSLLALSVSAD